MILAMIDPVFAIEKTSIPYHTQGIIIQIISEFHGCDLSQINARIYHTYSQAKKGSVLKLMSHFCIIKTVFMFV